MTAEIAVLNRTGVALAADSAVTIGRDANKIWTSADKLFQLSGTEPVGIMIYGNANHVNMPWETIIKTYRTKHPAISCKTVKQHAQHFMRFLGNSRGIFPTTSQDSAATSMCEALFRNLIPDLRTKIESEIAENSELTEGDIRRIASEHLISVAAVSKSKPLIKGNNKRDRDSYIRRIQSRATKARDDVFGDLPLTQRAKRAATQLCINRLLREWFLAGTTGLVVAGFGTEEYYPALVHYEVEDMACGRPRSRLDTDVSIDGEEQISVVRAFAQSDVVQLFMNGIDLELWKAITKSVKLTISNLTTTFCDAARQRGIAAKDDIDAIEEAGNRIPNELIQSWAQLMTAYWSPIVLNIGSLPKEELAAMAEAFVNLTKFKRRVTTERETVGGPIDVAVITKGDGFVWTKRKHYFDASKNPRFLRRIG